MHSWEFLKKRHLDDDKFIKILFKIRRWPLIKHLARNKLFNDIANIYDMVTTYIEAHDQVEESFND